MSGTPRNATPTPVQYGLRDDSRRQLNPPRPQYPTHLPLIMMVCERGDTTDAHIVIGDSAFRQYGRNTFDEVGKYANHATVLCNSVMQNANQVMIQRLKMPGSKKSTVRIALEKVAAEIPTYERGIDGKFKLDPQGDKIPTGETVTGFKLKWHALPITDDSVGVAPIGQGTMTDPDGNPSEIIPWIDFELPDEGVYGDNVGFRLSTVTVDASPPIDMDLVSSQLTCIHRVQFVERPTARSSANILENFFGENFVDFSLKPGAYNSKVRQDIFADRRILPTFHDTSDPNAAPYYGPFKVMHFYHNNIATILRELYAVESQHTSLHEGEGEEYQIDAFTCRNFDAAPYHALQLVGAAEGGILFTPNTTIYAMGGDDGDISLQAYDEAVRNQAANFGDLEIKHLDLLRYPCSVFYDSGFSIDTKDALATMMGRRKDLIVIAATQDANERPNLPSEETSLALAIAAAFRIHPESELYGTPAYRAAVVGQCGKIMGHQYAGVLPLTIQLAKWFSRYMGAGSKLWDTMAKPDVWPGNEVRDFRDVNIPYKPSNARQADWDNGLIWFQTSEGRTLFAPAMQTVYPDDTSVVNSLITAFIASHLQKVAVETWREMTGRTDLTREQFFDRSDEKILAKVRGLFDNRVVVVPRTFETGVDENNGYSWSTEIKFYANNMPTVNFITVASDRMSELS